MSLNLGAENGAFGAGGTIELSTRPTTFMGQMT
jgi:hypothetical protein